MRLHLIRHGKTVANEQNLYCGKTDLPVSPQGFTELATLKAQIVYPQAPLFITSGLLRSVQTLNFLFNEPTHYHTVVQLQEIHFGEFEMRHFRELNKIQSYQNWIQDIEHATPKGGESKQLFRRRVLDGLLEVEKLCNSNDVSSAIIVTHGGVIATIMEHFFPKEKNFYDWQPAGGLGYTLYLGETTHYKRI